MAFLGETPAVVQYNAPIGPMPETGDPLPAKMILATAGAVVVATAINPALGLLAAFGVAAVAGKKKKGQYAGGH